MLLPVVLLADEVDKSEAAEPYTSVDLVSNHPPKCRVFSWASGRKKERRARKRWQNQTYTSVVHVIADDGRGSRGGRALAQVGRCRTTSHPDVVMLVTVTYRTVPVAGRVVAAHDGLLR